LIAGTVPIVIGLSVAYVRGNTELQEVIGASFRALAEESASKIDAKIQRVIAADRLLAQQALATAAVREFLSSGHDAEGVQGVTGFDWPQKDRDSDVVLASRVTVPELSDDGDFGAENAVAPVAAGISGLQLGGDIQRYLIRISTPILDEKHLVGWLHRDHIVKILFDPLIYPTRFGDTGHVMLIDNSGAIVSCPLLVTGTRIDDHELIRRVARRDAGWITAENDGHGGRKFSIIGHAPLPGVNELLHAGVSWHMFVWQDSREIFAPARSLLIGVALAGLFAIGLLGILGYYASRRVLDPIRRLSDGATRIAGGDLNQKLDVRTGDEIEDLAGRLDEMRVQLRQLIGNLEEKVEERTLELEQTQVERDRVMQKLIQTEKVSAIGTMASGIGHEINNPLYAILGMAEAVRDEKDISACNQYGRDIIKYSKHIGEIVKNLSGYIRPANRQELEQVDVNDKLAEAISMVRRSLLDDRIEINSNLAPVPAISGKPEEILQIFFNVIRNGVQAIEGSGRVDVSSGQHDGRVRVRVDDTGVGIPSEHLGRIFDPFFTTKDPDQGEGMGLYIVQQIVKKYEGTITLESETGTGTTCTIRFPGTDRNEEETQ
jgi:signal transduction histidine kinase